jgi:hypothetical protein
MAGWLALEDSARGGAPNSVFIDPVAAAVAPGGSMTVSLGVEAPEAGLSGWQIHVRYDDSLLTAIGCTPDPEGACSMDFAPDAVESTGDLSESITGQLLAAEITFTAVGPAGQCSPLEVEVASFIDSNDTETNPSTSDGEVCLLGTPVPTPEPSLAVPPCLRFAEFNSDNFSDPTNIDNELLPLTPGSQLTLEGVAEGLARRMIYTATDVTKVVNGVRTVVMWARDFRDGALAEEGIAFFAQDDSGNVWNFGRYLEEHEDGKFIGAPDTWIAGFGLAEAGVHMPGEPHLNEPAFLRGWAPEIDFLECARITAADEQGCVPLACYENVLVTQETYPLAEAGPQQKYHAPEVGIVQIEAVEDPQGQYLSLVEDSQLDGEEAADARSSVLALDERAYENSEAYADTEPAQLPPGEPTPGPTGTAEPSGTPDATDEPSATPDESPEPTPVETPTPDPDESPDPTPAATSGSLGPATPTPGSSTLRSVPATTAPRPSRTPVALGVGRVRRSPLRSVRSLPSAGGADVSAGPISVGWMVPMALGLVLLGAYVYGTARANTVADPQAITPSQKGPSNPDQGDLIIARLDDLKRERQLWRAREMEIDAGQDQPESRDDST